MAYNPVDARLVGLKLSALADGVTIGLSPGLAYVPDTGRMLVQDDMSLVVAGATSAWRHFYLGNDAGVLKFEASATAPADPYQGTARTKSNDSTRRYLGSLYFGTDSKTTAFVHSQPGDRANRIDFTPPGGAALSTANLLTVGVLTGATQISAANVVPVTCRIMYCLIENTALLATGYLSTPDYGAVSASNYLLSIKPSASGQYDVFLNGSQQLSYIMAGGLISSGGLTIKVRGYLFDR